MFAVFDLDGTLLDTLKDISDSINQVLKEHSLPIHSYDDYKIFIGEGLRVLLQRAFPNLPEYQSEKAIQSIILKTREVYASNLYRATKPYSGINNLLTKLNEKNITLGVLSNKPDDMTKKLVHYFFEKIPFIEIMGASDKFPRKPDPQSLNYIIEKIGEPPSSGFFIGDTITDIETAQRANIKSIGVQWGFRPKETKMADYVVKSASEIEEIILES